MLNWQAQQWITEELRKSGLVPEEAAWEARLLLAAALALPLCQLPLHRGEPADLDWLRPRLQRRCTGEPLQYILGETEFMGLTYRALPQALIPRGDSEIVVEKAISLLRQMMQTAPGAQAAPGTQTAPGAQAASGTQTAPGAQAAPSTQIAPGAQVERGAHGFADICTGGGAFAIAMAHFLPGICGYAVDISPDALSLARENALLHGVAAQIDFICGDLLLPLIEKNVRLPLIIANPPYIPSEEIPRLGRELAYEPLLALDGGADGLQFYRRLAAQAPAALCPGGYLLLEHGVGQRQALCDLLAANGLHIVECLDDYGHRDRAVLAQTLPASS